MVKQIDLPANGVIVDGKVMKPVLDIRVQPDGTESAAALVDCGRAPTIVVKVSEFK